VCRVNLPSALLYWWPSWYWDDFAVITAYLHIMHENGRNEEINYGGKKGCQVVGVL
jgi:hypothetical protein